MDATRQARNSYRVDVQSALWFHERSKISERTTEEQRQTVDLLAQVATLRPRRIKNRLQRTLAASANARRDAKELERFLFGSCSCAHPFSYGHAHIETPDRTVDELSVPGSRTWGLHSEERVRTVKKFMAWLGLTHQLAFPTSYLQYAQYLEVRQSEPAYRGALVQCHAAFQFLESAAGLPDTAKSTTSEVYDLVYKDA